MDNSEELILGEKTWRNAIQPIIKDGYREGHENGRKESFQNGFDKGYKEGFEDAYKMAYQTAIVRIWCDFYLSHCEF